MPPARPKTAAKAASRVAVKPKPGGVFARLKEQAAKDAPELEPYVIDDVEPPIVIEAPTDSAVQLEIAELFGEDGGFAMKDARKIIRLLAGDAFDRVMEVFGREHISVLLALIDDMGRHFQEQRPELAEVADFPGGSHASST